MIKHEAAIRALLTELARGNVYVEIKHTWGFHLDACTNYFVLTCEMAPQVCEIRFHREFHSNGRFIMISNDGTSDAAYLEFTHSYYTQPGKPVYHAELWKSK